MTAFRNVFQTDFARSLIQFSGEKQFASSCPGALGYGAWVMVVTSLCLSKVAELQTRTARKKDQSAFISTCFVTARPDALPNLTYSEPGQWLFCVVRKEKKISSLRAVMVYRRSSGTDPLILNSALYGGGRLTSRPVRFTQGINNGTHRTGTQWCSSSRHCATS